MTLALVVQETFSSLLVVTLIGVRMTWWFGYRTTSRYVYSQEGMCHLKRGSYIYLLSESNDPNLLDELLNGFDMNPQRFVVDLSMRSVRNSICGWRWRSWPDYSLPSCTLATNTPPPTAVVILWSTINQTTRVIPASNRGTSKNK
jgi:hypothetical protein